MRVAIIHLSDIHFRDGSNPVSSRADAISGAIRPCLQEVEAVVFAITGDIAYSGFSSQYKIASEFFSRLRETAENVDKVGVVEFVAIPGNHDCDFSEQGDMRQALLDGLQKKIAELDPEGEIARQLTEVHANFFAFEAELSARDEIPRLGRLRYQRGFRFGDVPFLFDCYNTAWTSQKNERQGTLLFPPKLLSDADIDDGDSVRISLLHHRDNCLEANNARYLREYVETYSDFILSGHEHHGDSYAKIGMDGRRMQYIEGAVLQDHTQPGTSGFNVLEIDLGRSEKKVVAFRWSGQRFVRDGTAAWERFERNSAGRAGVFRVSSGFSKTLNDVGTGFFHSSKPDLTLEDIFVYPDLRRKSLRKLVASASPVPSVFGPDFVKFVASSKRLVISGPDDSGKTSLARMLYLDLRRNPGLTPVLLDGAQIHGKHPDAALEREVRRAVSEQYSSDLVEDFLQLPPGRKALIVDDWHKVRYGDAGQASFVREAERRFEVIVCFSDDVFAVNQIKVGEDRPFGDYELCEIRELGHLRRNELIRRWLSLGTTLEERGADLARSVSTMESTVNTLLGKNLLPAYPVIVLSILQSAGANRAPNSSAGSYGQMYEALITAALASVSSKAVELGTKYTYLSLIAHHVFTTNRHELEIADMQAVHSEYHKQYRVPVNLYEMLDQLALAQILSRSNGTFRFRYKYIYCYFVAKYFQDGIANRTGEGDLRRKLGDIADKVYFEDYANIIIFYVYLTKDREFIEQLLANATRIYREVEPCDLDTHVEFVNKLGVGAPELVLPPTDVERNREAALRRKDEAEEQIRVVDEVRPRLIKYEDGLPDIVKFHIALRNLRILGQILRNFPGSLKADLKVDLAFGTYQLGLRTLRAVLGIAESNVDELRTYIAQLILERSALDDHERLSEKTDRVLIDLTRSLAFAMMKRISYAVGLEELEETYEDILQRDGHRLPIRLIDYTIRLDHFARFPKASLEQMIDETRKNPFSLRLVRDLTAEYLYLFPAENRVRQFIGEKLNIKVNTAQALGAGSKKLKKLPAGGR